MSTSASHSVRLPIHLFVDFDSTLTTASTLSTLVTRAVALLPPSAPRPCIPDLINAYTAARKSHDAAYPVPAPDRNTLQDELDYEASLEAVERASIERLEAAGVFAAIRTDKQLEQEGRKAVLSGEVRLRNGWCDALEAVPGRDNAVLKGRVTVVSVAWSRSWIRGCLGATMPRDFMEQVDIVANEVDLAHAGTGRLDRWWPEGDRGIWTGTAKLQAMKENGSAAQVHGPHDDQPLRVYCGDSPTDLACLLDADVGICLRGHDGQYFAAEAQDLERILDRLGILRDHVGEFTIAASSDREREREERTSLAAELPLVSQNATRPSQRLYWARDFEEIVQSGVLDSSDK